MSKIIYVVTAGDYSDYGICAVFDNKELAQIFIDSREKRKWSWDEMSIEEWTLNPAEEFLRSGRKPCWLRIDVHGNTRDFEIGSNMVGKNLNSESSIGFTHDNEWMNVECYAMDEQHAVKIANERRIQILATNKWGNNVRK